MTERKEIVRPDARRMIEGLRDTGYDFVTAVADLIDNSIAANANQIHIVIDMDFQGNITLMLSDNGTGMDEDALRNAMKYGSNERPDPMSLGKFGLGLKTASTAFCRRLSVISRPSGDVNAQKATWDLDHVAQVGEWELLFSDPTRQEVTQLNDIANNSSGTLVTWNEVDRLLKDYAAPGGTFAQKALDREVESLKDHIAMTYQRFLDPNDPRENHKVRINVEHNGKTSSIIPWDPFAVNESELVAEETIRVGPEDSEEIIGEFTVRAFVLPRREEFSSPEAAKLANISNDKQGIYIYRENRLIHAADWLGMYQQESHGSLLRVEFSFDHRLDEALQVDIKKSKISLNEDLYRWLKDDLLPPPRRAADERYRKGRQKQVTKTAKGGAHDSSNNNIGSKEKDIPKAKIEKVDTERGQADISNSNGRATLRIKITPARSEREIFVQPADDIRDGLLWSPVLITDNGQANQGVQINTSHPFYEKVYIPNIMSATSSSINVQGLDALLWALGIAELNTVSDDTKRHFEDMRYEISRILRRLVADLPEPKELDEVES